MVFFGVTGTGAFDMFVSGRSFITFEHNNGIKNILLMTIAIYLNNMINV